MKSTPALLLLSALTLGAPRANAQVTLYRNAFEQVQLEEIPYGGRVTTIAVNPKNADDVIIGTGHGGMYHSHDGGMHWQYVTTFSPQRVSCVSFSPVDSNVVLATAPGENRSQRGTGVWLSADGGSTWAQPLIAPGCTAHAGAHAISWVNSNTVWVAGECGLLRSDDRGTTWTEVNVRDGSETEASKRMYTVLAIDADHVIAGGAAGYYYMHDGKTWHRSVGAHASFHCMNGLAVSPVDPKLLFRADYTELRAPWWLEYSTDQGITWRDFPDRVPLDNMPPFVRTTRTDSSAPGDFDLYVGDGAQLKRTTIHRCADVCAHSEFETATLDHSDPADIAFHPVTGRPLLLAGDGGVMQTGDGGKTWLLVGAGAGGLHALEIYGVTAQKIRKPLRTTDIAFTTWHNLTWNSTDGGKRWRQFGPAEATGMRASGPNAKPGEGLVSMQPWAGSVGFYVTPPILSGTPADIPAPAALEPSPVPPPYTPSPGSCYGTAAYFRNPIDAADTILLSTTNCDGASVVYDRRAATESTWHEVGRSSAGSFQGPPQVAVRDGAVTMYQVVNRAGRNVLARMSSANAAGKIRFPLMRNFGETTMIGDGVEAMPVSLGTIAATGYGGELAWAVKPDDERILIAADKNGGTMLMSEDGGDHWRQLPELTDLVTDHHSLPFCVDDGLQVSTIAFDPYDTTHVVVGTMEAGLVESHDSGETWRQVSGSAHIPFITSLAFADDHVTYVGSGGRGLWKWWLVPARTIGGYHGTLPSFTIDGASWRAVAPSDRVHLHGSGFLPRRRGETGVPVVITIGGRQAAVASTDERGEFDAVVSGFAQPGPTAIVCTQAASSREKAVTAREIITVSNDDGPPRRQPRAD